MLHSLKWDYNYSSLHFSHTKNSLCIIPKVTVMISLLHTVYEQFSKWAEQLTDRFQTNINIIIVMSWWYIWMLCNSVAPCVFTLSENAKYPASQSVTDFGGNANYRQNMIWVYKYSRSHSMFHVVCSACYKGNENLL
jgi:hypothetical protein